MKYISKQQGFTLIEVLIALVILAIALTAIIKAVSNNTRNLIYLQDKTAAHWVAMNIYNEYALGLLTISPQLEPANGSTIMFNKDWYWSAQFNPLDDDTLQIHLRVREHPEQKSLIDLIAQLPSEVE